MGLTNTEEEWDCPICQELLYKPVVASCQHIFCFWCMHRAMSPFNSSRCPLCRSSFGHFPDVCNVLHHFLLRAFPENYETRAEETRENEQEEEVDSVEVSPPAAFSENVSAQAVLAKDARWSVADFLCSRPECAQLLRDPVILNCGCAVCSGCVPDAGHPCARCGAISVTQPRPCTKLKDLVEELFPGKEFDRLVQSGASAAAAQPRDAAAPEAAGQRAKRKTMDLDEPCADDSSAPSPSPQPEGAAEAGGDAASTQPPGEEEPTMPDAIHSRLRSNVTHFGIGCDFCGQYPIVGKRFQCLDCPERVGFDLCDACYNRRSNVHGRFNQHHTAEHRMREVAVTPNILHILQAANPDMDMSQILNMMQMAWEADPDPPIPHAHRGGPRPATTDPFAPGNLAAAAILAHGQLLDTAGAAPGARAPPDATPTPDGQDAQQTAAVPPVQPQPDGQSAAGVEEQEPGQATAPAAAAQGVLQLQIGQEGIFTVILPQHTAAESDMSGPAGPAHADPFTSAEFADAVAAHMEAEAETERADNNGEAG